VGITVIERVKIQAQVLVPLVKALQAELGEERANALVRKTLGDIFRRLGQQWWQSKQSDHVGDNMASAVSSWARGDALDYKVRAQSQDIYEVDVTGCRYAQFYKELGEPELGFLLACGQDFSFTEGLGSGIKLTRTQTIMQGASHCDFRYRRQKDWQVALWSLADILQCDSNVRLGHKRTYAVAATPVMAANPRGLVGTHANAAHDGYDRIYGGSEPGPAYYGNFGIAPEGLNPAIDPWGRARGPNDTNAPGCPLRSCDWIVKKELRPARERCNTWW
jgi:L-2-amino-thiazoline-4-carboxylic acid hydrolase